MAIGKKRLLYSAGILPVFVILLVIYAHAGRYYPLNSDWANILLEGRAIAQGNPLLSHWYLTTVSYYTTDAIFFGLAMHFLPMKAGTVHNVYAALYAALVLSSVWLAGRRHGAPRLDRSGMAIAFAILAFPSQYQGVSIFVGPMHMGTMFWVILALLSLDFPTRRSDEKLPWLRLAAALVFLSLALIGDTLTLYVAVAPIALVSLLRLRRGHGNRYEEFAILGVCVAAEVATKLFTIAIRLLHGFQTVPSYNSNAAFIDLDNLGSNVQYTAEGLLRIYNADFFGLPIGHTVLLPFLGFLGVGVLIFCLARSLKDIKASQQWNSSLPPADRIVAVLAIGMVVNLLSYMLSNLLVGLMTIRYLVPFAVYAAILLGRYGVSLWRENPDQVSRREWAAVFALAAFSWFYAFGIRALRQPLPGPTPMAQLGEWLRAHNLTYGYGTYWTGVITVETHGAVQVNPIILHDGKIAPYLWGVDERWYQDKPVHFLVIEHPDYGGVNVTTAIQTLGQPSAQYSVVGYTVLVWDKDITPLLGKPKVAR